MNTRGDVEKLRLVLWIGAMVFGLSAVLLVALPRFFTDLLGLAGSSALDWSMQMIGLTLVALTGNMMVVSLHGTDRGVLLSGRVMQIAAFGLGVVTLLIPAEMNWFVILYAVVGFGFSAAYTFFLLAKSK